MDDRSIVITTDDGKEHICDILFTYHSEQFNKDYVLFVPRGQNQVSAAIYKEDSETSGQFIAIETEEEWTMLEQLLDDYYNQMDDGEGCSGNCGSCGSGCSDCNHCDED